MGWSFVSIGSLNLDLASAFWSRLAGGLDYVYTLEDVKSQDTLLASSLERIRESAITLTDEEFKAVFGD